MLEKLEFKHSFWVWQIILLQIIIDPCPRRAEIRNSCGTRDPCSDEYADLLNSPLLDCSHDSIYGTITLQNSRFRNIVVIKSTTFQLSHITFGPRHDDLRIMWEFHLRHFNWYYVSFTCDWCKTNKIRIAAAHSLRFVRRRSFSENGLSLLDFLLRQRQNLFHLVPPLFSLFSF